MPNHIHLIWRIKELNGKETARGSFLKYTAHEFKKMLQKEVGKKLALYAIDAHNKKHEFGKGIYWRCIYIQRSSVSKIGLFTL